MFIEMEMMANGEREFAYIYSEGREYQELGYDILTILHRYTLNIDLKLYRRQLIKGQKKVYEELIKRAKSFPDHRDVSRYVRLIEAHEPYFCPPPRPRNPRRRVAQNNSHNSSNGNDAN
jgi:hypothetical protein